MCVFGMGSSTKFDLLVGTFKGNIKPCQEGVNVCKVLSESTSHLCVANVQSFRVACRVNGARNVRSSFLAVRKSICYTKVMNILVVSVNGEIRQPLMDVGL